VNVVAIGIVAEDEIIHSAVPPEAADEPYDIILVGKPTDDSGFGGSAFASKILGDEEEKAEDRGAVQVPDPFLKNVLLMRKANEDVRRAAREQGVAIGVKDIGGGGLACGSSEIGSMGGFGVDIDLEKVHVGLEDLLPETITCAETQERYILAVPRRFTPTVLRIYNEDWDLPNIYEGACAAVIGQVTENEDYVLRFGGKVVADAPIEFVTSGIQYEREARPREFDGEEPDFEQPEDLSKVLLSMLGSENLASREYIYRAYDTEVQGNAVVRPGEADAGVIAPLEGETVGVALAVDGNPLYGTISPYWAGANAVAECMRNVAAVGAVPSGLTDCLNFGNPEKPEAFWEFRGSVRGLSDAAKNIWFKGHENTAVPVVSGNVSFYNESATGQAVLPSPIIACIGIMPDYSKAVTMQLRRPGNVLLLLGERHDELGGSEYYRLVAGTLGANVPQVRFEQERANIYTVIDAIDGGLVASCHDISNGGIVCTLAEMCMGGYARGKCGAEVGLEPMANGLRADKALFGESGGFVLEVAPNDLGQVAEIAGRHGTEVVEVGRVTEAPALEVTHDGRELVNCALDDMKAAWTGGLAKVLA
ncbi:MAG: AIR synthase-related protein, partial [Armatimonadota bacterium]